MRLIARNHPSMRGKGGFTFRTARSTGLEPGRFRQRKLHFTICLV